MGDEMDGSRSPVDSLSMATMSLLAIPRPLSPSDPLGLLRSDSQASSLLSLSSSSSDGSSTPTEDYLPPISYQPPHQPKQQPPPKAPPRLRPIIKTQHLARSQSPMQSPTTPQDQISQIDSPSSSASRAFSPQLTNTLDRPKLPSVSPQVNRPTHGTRTPSINFSRPYSSRSSMYSDTSSA